MNKRSDRLRRVQSIAESEERDYCRAMSEAQRVLNEHLEQLQDLQNYRQDYTRDRNPGTPGRSISSAQYSDYQNFLQRLDDAVRAQADAVRSNEQKRDAHRERWMLKRQKTESLKRVVDRYAADELRDGERLQQKVQDDMPRQQDPFRRGS